MLIYLIPLASLAVLAYIYKNNLQIITIKRKIAIIMWVELVLISILRKISVGIDMKIYIEYFKIVERTSWKDLFKIDWDPGYLILNKVISEFTGDIYIFQAVLAIIIVTITTLAIYENSDDIIISFFLFITLGYFNMGLNLIRQMIAVAIILYSYKYIKQKMLKKYIIAILIASTFHITAIIFLPVYFFRNKNIEKKNIKIFIIGIIGIYGFSEIIIKELVEIYRNNYLDLIIKGEGIKLLLIYIGMFSIMMLVRKKYQEKYPEDKIMYYIILILTTIQLVTTKFSLLGRLGIYFSIFIILIVPKVISLTDEKYRRKLKVLIYICGIIFYIWTLKVNLDGTGVYNFLWK